MTTFTKDLNETGNEDYVGNLLEQINVFELFLMDTTDYLASKALEDPSPFISEKHDKITNLNLRAQEIANSHGIEW